MKRRESKARVLTRARVFYADEKSVLLFLVLLCLLFTSFQIQANPNPIQTCEGVHELPCHASNCDQVHEKFFEIDVNELGKFNGDSNLYDPQILSDDTHLKLRHDGNNLLFLSQLRLKNDGEECYVHELPVLGSFLFCRGPYAKLKIALAPVFRNQDNQVINALTGYRDQKGQFEKRLANLPYVNFVDQKSASLPGPFNTDGRGEQCEWWEVDKGPLQYDQEPFRDELGREKNQEGISYQELFQGKKYSNSFSYDPIGIQNVSYKNYILWDWDNFCKGQECFHELQVLIFESDDMGVADDVLAFFTIKKDEATSMTFENSNLRVEFLEQKPLGLAQGVSPTQEVHRP